MKKLLYFIIDLFIVYGSIVFVFFILKRANIFEDFFRNFEAFKLISPFVGIFYLLLVYAFKAYDISYKRYSEIVYTIFLISILLMIGIMGICFFVRNLAFAFPRSVIILSALLYFTSLTLWRMFLMIFTCKARKVKKIIIIGNRCDKLKRAITHKYPYLHSMEHLCSEDFPTLFSRIAMVDEIYICSGISQKIRKIILSLCIKYKKDVCFVPGYFDVSMMSSSFCKTEDIPTFRLHNMRLSLEERLVKRAIDLIFGFVAFILLLPIGLVFAFMVKLDGGGIFYTQERLTEGHRKFTILKFRTMISNAESLSGPILAEEDDNRITRVGKLMRFLRLDEIPQIINVLKGDMSIVGPRPERPCFVEKFEKQIPEYSYRLRVKAGLTGLAQVEGRYSTDVKDKLLYDLIYINNYFLLKDIFIMLQTVRVLFVRDSTKGVILQKKR